MPRAKNTYHHGDLRAACVSAARELLEEDGGGALSLRAVAKRAGVSATAPYRHFADRDALVSAVAAEGYRELAEHLALAHPSPTTPADLAEIAIAYVRFALEHPALFRAMFAEPCDPEHEERSAATAAIWTYVHDLVHAVFPEAEPEALSTAVWSLVHGLAFLYLDGKLDATDTEEIAGRIRSTVRAMLTAGAAVERG
ncbi:TetR/AcrR family transcriptional regulator [Nocardiopsis alba]|uniref:TetR/AcrR family transcriptional regulator n=1 Tax=Nocardiopsis alba TaxID=53437 RepID=UPI0033DB5EFA